jgi:hypothetical protein
MGKALMETTAMLAEKRSLSRAQAFWTLAKPQIQERVKAEYEVS